MNNNDNLFNITRPAEIHSPIVLSIPHSGTEIPEELREEFKTEMLPADDTDWFVDDLYAFGKELGILTIKANYSRLLIDLNRNLDGVPLYSDGRVITSVCPATDFNGTPIYTDERISVSSEEIKRRKEKYFSPYYAAVQSLLDEVHQKFGVALLWDCHSIRRYVPGVRTEKFPDLILGTADGATVPVELEQLVSRKLASGNYQLSLNTPFKGGNITRCFGLVQQKQYAIQLEMSKDIYMDDSETKYHPARAAKLQQLLRETLQELDNNLLI
ncbi:N-formylglutamate amidohydrolase [Mangrovibacterium marinum]|uniref:N-formylglutamate deformylase n=1 Tax=Mangrovibacterium marinum TaxID=1639118 RepID=A0A2T5BYP7_9BACT|nr:N-formylglutamate amidohydrolase [Mangrovibacterium marinum]PTN07367.1 N-formylglutamate deformylase [Mangrovibacterium marinum]